MAGEFKIKTGLLLGAAPSQIVTNITDSSSFLYDSSTLASVNAIKNYSESNFVPSSGGAFRGDVSILFPGALYTDAVWSYDKQRFLNTTNSVSIGGGINYVNCLNLGTYTGSNVISGKDDVALKAVNGKIYFASDVSAYSPIRYARHFNSPDLLDIPDVSYLNWKIDVCIGSISGVSKIYVDGSLLARDVSIQRLSTWNATQDASLINKLNTSGGIITGDLSINGKLYLPNLDSSVTKYSVNYDVSTDKLYYSDVLWRVDNSVLTPYNDNYDVKVSSLEIQQDAGVTTFINMPISTTPGAGIEESYSFDMDGSTVMKIYGLTTGTGVLSQTAVVIQAKYQYMGDPTQIGAWRFYVDGSSNLVFEKQTSSNVWTQGGKFVA